MARRITYRAVAMGTCGVGTNYAGIEVMYTEVPNGSVEHGIFTSKAACIKAAKLFATSINADRIEVTRHEDVDSTWIEDTTSFELRRNMGPGREPQVPRVGTERYQLAWFDMDK